MVSLVGTSKKTSTSTNQMFPALEAGWNTVLGDAASVYGSSRIPKQAPLNSDIKNSFQQTRDLANAGVPNLDQIYGVQSGILANGGMTGTMQDSVGYLTNFANGSYQDDPRLQRVVDAERQKALNATATMMGGGRYGSAAIGDKFSQSASQATDQLMLQSNENARNRQLQAAGQIGQLGTAGAQNMSTWAAMSPALNEMRYDGAARQASIGQYLQDRTQNRNDQRANFPWQDLQSYAGILSGMGNMGGTTVQTKPGPSAAQSILGGGLAGMKFGSEIPGLGAGWGGILGGVAGAFA